MTEGDGTAGAAEPGADPVMDLIAALRRVASNGSAAIGSLIQHPEAARAVGSLMAMMGPMAGGTAGGRDAPRSGVAGEALGFVGQAYMLAAASGFRYWRRVAETCGEHQIDLLRAMGGGQQNVEVVEGLRECARKLGDVSLQEARLFQAELDRLAAALQPTGTEESGPYRRRSHPKP